MKKKMISIFVMVVLLLLTVNVDASDFSDIYGTIEKSNDSGELYNLMPTMVEKDKEFSINLVIKNIKGWRLSKSEFRIYWDKEAFDIVEENGKYFKVIDEENIKWASANLIRDNGINVYFEYDSAPFEDAIKTISLKFKTKKNVKDGFYNIYLEPNNTIEIIGENEYARINNTVLKFQVGKPVLVSNYSKDNFNIGDYIIGEYLFSREPNEYYPGYLTTEHIMLASKSIDGNTMDDMIIYVNTSARGWVNAITGEIPQILPDEFKIKYVNMITNYQENGIYSDNDDKTRLRLIQINDKEAIITIESDKEIIHGFATMNNKVATLKVGNNNYVITILDNAVSIESSDNYLRNTNLEKRTNYSINDYYNDNYLFPNELGYSSTQYLNSQFTGKYVNTKYELYLYRINEKFANICIKEKGKNACLIKKIVESNIDGFIIENNVKTTYAYKTEESNVGIDWNNEQITLTCTGTCTDIPFTGTFNKESSLTMENVIKAWEENKVYYRVLFNKQNGEDANKFYAEPNVPLDNYSEVWSYFDDHYKEGYIFIEWKYNDDKKFNITDKIDGPISLKAEYAQLPTKPTISLDDENGEYDSQLGEFVYNLIIQSTTEFDRVNIYQKSNNSVVASGGRGTTNIRLLVQPNIENTYYAITYRVIDIKYPSEQSNEITINPRVYTVSFNTNGGTSIPDQQLAYGQKAVRPTDPTRQEFEFEGWQLNGDTYDFDTPVEANITLNAVWKRVLAAPTLSIEQQGTGWAKLSVIYEGNYASTYSGIDGMSLYEVVGGIPTSIYAGEELTYLAKNVSKTYIARIYIVVNNERVYSDYSNKITVNNVINAPVIELEHDSTNVNQIRSFVYDEQHDAFEFNLIGDYSLHTISGCTSGNCFTVDNYKWYEKNGNELVQVYDGGIGSVAPLYVPEGSRKTFVAKAYTTAYNGDIVYSSESNEITIDLTNPTYTYEMIESQADSTKYIVRAYINNYEVSFEQIIINGSDYPDEGGDAEFDVSKEDIDSEGNITSLTLQLSDDMFVVATKR